MTVEVRYRPRASSSGKRSPGGVGVVSASGVDAAPPGEGAASHSHSLVASRPAGGSVDSDCAFEGDYAVPPLSMAEGMQHIRIMEGVSRSLPSSPLLTHQTISVRLQPVKKLTGK